MNCVQEIPTKPLQNLCEFETYLCLEQPETIEYLDYLSVEETQHKENHSSTVIFNSDHDEENKKGKRMKKFHFDGIFNQVDKIKHYFSPMIRNVSERVVQGENINVLLYGTEEKCKDKILFGESQNHGLFLCIISEIFDFCHSHALEEFVTIKISCSLFKNSKFYDIYTGLAGVQLTKDILEGSIFHTIPQIIIRNVKTALKIVNLIWKTVLEMREEDLTQNFILTTKFQLDCKKKEEETELYCLSKLNFIKLANPSVNNSLKGVNKNNIWFINLLNLLQQKKDTESQQVKLDYLLPLNENADLFTLFLKENVFKESSKIYGIISLTNKTTSNQCLTSLLYIFIKIRFGTHLKQKVIHPQRKFIDLVQLSEKVVRIEENLMIRVIDKIKNTEQKFKFCGFFRQILDLISHYMTEMNYLEYEYSLCIGEACEKLNKYIFTEELEDFFYAKKIALEADEDLFATYQTVKKIKAAIVILRKKIMHLFEDKTEFKQIIDEILKYYFSLSHHFIYEQNEKLQLKLNSQLSKFEEQKQSLFEKNEKMKEENDKRIKIVKDSLHENHVSLEKDEAKQNQKSPKLRSPNKKPQKSTETTKRSPNKSLHYREGINELECMFKNKNVSLKKWEK